MAFVIGGKHFGQYTYEHWFDHEYGDSGSERADVHFRLASMGVAIPEILLPKSGIDLSKWAVIACDQFTQDRDYWEKVKAFVDGSPSCLNLIFPEAYLEDGDAEGKKSRIREIRDFMDSYMREEIFALPRRCCMYVERGTPRHPKRRGLVLAVDLDQYDWAPDSRRLIRSTEGTIAERLLPRIEIRCGAPLELPHILLLIDDEDDSLIPSLGEIAQKRAPLYDTPLMMDSGAVKGWALDTEEAWAALADGLENLAKKAVMRYGEMQAGESPFLFAMGDGNHSLATAKAVWEDYKKNHSGDEADLKNHPARWALVEVENLYDSGISFEPIHRVVFGVEPKKINELINALSVLKDLSFHPDEHVIRIPGGHCVFRIRNHTPDIATASLQPILDSFVSERNLSVDYIHGEEEVFRLAADPDRDPVGLILPPIKKEGLFKTVAQTGPLPRKSFSMGDAEEKRFYLECRRLFG